jgi:hypothetical protein
MSMPPTRSGGPGEVLVHHALVETDGFEDLRAAIALDRGDARSWTTLTTPLVAAFTKFLQAFLWSIAGEQPWRIMSSIVSKAR